MVGAGAFRVERHLCGNPLARGFDGKPVPLGEAAQLRLRIDPDHDHLLDAAGPIAFVEQGNIEDQDARPRPFRRDFGLVLDKQAAASSEEPGGKGWAASAGTAMYSA